MKLSNCKTSTFIIAVCLLNLGALTTAFAQNPVETEKPTADFKPAFSGQTRIAGVKTSTAIDISIINEKLDRPWAISELPKGGFLITQKAGNMVILTADGKLSKTIEGLPKVDDSGQGGVLDVTLDPDFSKNRMIYWAYSEPQTKGVLLAIAKGKLSQSETSIENQPII